MARTVIPTNFKDDELAEEMQGRRRYRQILNLDGTVSFEDETDYDTEGSTFGASRVNEMAQNINESADVNKIIDDLEDIAVVTQNGFMAGAKAVKELNSNLTAKLPTDIEGFSVGEDGKPYITYKVGADSVTKKLGNGYIESFSAWAYYNGTWKGGVVYSNTEGGTGNGTSVTGTLAKLSWAGFGTYVGWQFTLNVYTPIVGYINGTEVSLNIGTYTYYAQNDQGISFILYED